MSLLHDQMRSLIAEMGARRPKPAPTLPREPMPHTERPMAYSARSTCSLCDSPSYLQVCGRCSDHFKRGGTL